MPYAVVDADEVEPEFMGAFKQIRKPLGLTAFGINQIELAPGVEGREHDHADSPQEEVYLVLRGGGVLRVDGEESSCGPAATSRAACRSPVPTASRSSPWAPGRRTAGSRTSRRAARLGAPRCVRLERQVRL